MADKMPYTYDNGLLRPTVQYDWSKARRDGTCLAIVFKYPMQTGVYVKFIYWDVERPNLGWLACETDLPVSFNIERDFHFYDTGVFFRPFDRVLKNG